MMEDNTAPELSPVEIPASASEELLADEPIKTCPLPLDGQIEAVIFASPQPLKVDEILALALPNFADLTKELLEQKMAELVEKYQGPERGFRLVYLPRLGYQFQTAPEASPLMERQFASRPRPLSRAALETLAIISYRQKKSKGVTRAEVEFIRGVDAGGMFKSLMERGLVTCVGRKEIPGRPLLFGVTDEFLRTFQISSVDDLPPLESFQMAQDMLQAAQQKIEDFEREQEEKEQNVEEFIGDTPYQNELAEREPSPAENTPE